jgi:hypothetical protein
MIFIDIKTIPTVKILQNKNSVFFSIYFFSPFFLVVQFQEQLIKIKAYRQSLRDFININKEKILNNEEVIFPQSPNFII